MSTDQTEIATMRGSLGWPTWAMTQGQPLSLWVHTPDVAEAVGAVVVAPSFGREGASSFRAVRSLCITLARRGFVAVRLSWRGDGDSAEAPSDNLVEHWRDDVRAAAEVARGLLPGSDVHGIGLRLGAAVLATTGLTGVRLLWEPVSGKKFLREQGLLRRLSVPIPVAEEGVEAPGRHFTDEAVLGVRGLRLPDGGDDSLVWTVNEPGPDERKTLYGGAPHETSIPHARLHALVNQLPRSEPRPIVPLDVPSQVEHLHHGALIRQRCITISSAGLPAVVSEPADREPRCVVLLTGAGSEPMGGPTGLWATFSRELAARGAVCLRAERSGQGDHDRCVNLREANPYSDQGVIDCVAGIEWARAQYPGLPVHCVGLCVGGWLWLRAARMAAVDSITVFNPVGWRPHPRHYQNLHRFDWLRALLSAGNGDDAGDASEELKCLPGAGTPGFKARLRETLKSARWAVKKSVPDSWWALGGRGGLVEDAVVLLSGARCEVRIHIGPEDVPQWTAARGPAAVATLSGRGQRVTARVHDNLDHSLLSLKARETARHEVHALMD